MKSYLLLLLSTLFHLSMFLLMGHRQLEELCNSRKEIRELTGFIQAVTALTDEDLDVKQITLLLT